MAKPRFPVDLREFLKLLNSVRVEYLLIGGRRLSAPLPAAGSTTTMSRQGYAARTRAPANYRMLYFFHGNTAAVVSHGIIKEAEVPPKEIDRAIRRKQDFLKEPSLHTYEES